MYICVPHIFPCCFLPRLTRAPAASFHDRTVSINHYLTIRAIHHSPPRRTRIPFVFWSQLPGVSGWLPTAAGLALIPFIVAPLDNLVEEVSKRRGVLKSSADHFVFKFRTTHTESSTATRCRGVECRRHLDERRRICIAPRTIGQLSAAPKIVFLLCCVVCSVLFCSSHPSVLFCFVMLFPSFCCVNYFIFCSFRLSVVLCSALFGSVLFFPSYCFVLLFSVLPHIFVMFCCVINILLLCSVLFWFCWSGAGQDLTALPLGQVPDLRARAHLRRGAPTMMIDRDRMC